MNKPIGNGIAGPSYVASSNVGSAHSGLPHAGLFDIGLSNAQLVESLPTKQKRTKCDHNTPINGHRPIYEGLIGWLHDAVEASSEEEDGWV
jgi:hypothetical protein